MLTLRPYQTNAVQSARHLIAQRKRRLILVSPTGSGKTVVATGIIESAVAKGKKILFVAHRKELIDQASAKLDSFGLDHGIIMAQHWRRDPQKHVQVASIQTWRSWVAQSEKLPESVSGYARMAWESIPWPALQRAESNALFPIVFKPDLIIIDEAHLSIAKSYMDLVAAFPNAVVLGLTATPVRGDGRPLGDIYHDMVQVSSVKALISDGYLVQPRHFAPATPDLTQVSIATNGEYDEDELADAMNRPELVGNLVQEWIRRAMGRPTIVFAVNRQHSKEIAAIFQANGIRCIHLDGLSSKYERENGLRQLANGEIDAISNVGLFTEGLDLPAVSCIVLARPTRSLALYLQMSGRGLRPSEDKDDCIILDHAGSTLEFGLVVEDREWSLDGKHRKSKEVQECSNTQICEECHAVFPKTDDACPECGWQKEHPETQITAERPAGIGRNHRTATTGPSRGRNSARRTRQGTEPCANTGRSSRPRQGARLQAGMGTQNLCRTARPANVRHGIPMSNVISIPQHSGALWDMAADIAAIKGGKPVASGQNFSVRCPMPGHDDAHRSFSVGMSPDGAPLVRCHGGCQQSDVIGFLRQQGIWQKYAPGKKHSNGQARSQHKTTESKRMPGLNNVPVSTHATAMVHAAKKTKKTYVNGWVHPYSDQPRPSYLTPTVGGKSYAGHWEYHDSCGTLIGIVARYQDTESKVFYPFFTPSNAPGVFSGHIPAAWAKRPLFDLHKIVASDPNTPVWITEGEACARAVQSLGAVATTSFGGSNAARKTDWAPLRKRKIILWGDYDEPGVRYINSVRSLLQNIASEIQVVDLNAIPGLQRGVDVLDWIEQGHRNLEDLPLRTLNPNDPYSIGHSGTTAATDESGENLYAPLAEPTIIAKAEEGSQDKMAPSFLSAVFLAQQLDLRFDRFKNMILLNGKPVDEAHIREYTLKFCERGRTRFPIYTVKDAFITVAQRRSFHPVENHLKSLSWDGTERLHECISNIFHVEPTEYHTALGKNFFTMAAMRILHPGCKADNMLLLYGKQGKGKSSFVNHLAFDNPEWHSEIWDNPSNKDFYQNLQGNWVIELSELDSFRGAAETSIKRFITAQNDNYRPPYESETKRFPRQCVFIGTTNNPQPLTELNGNRRYWPVLADHVDLDYLIAHRDQLWAEAVHLARNGHRYWEMPQGTEEMQEKYRSQHKWEAQLGKWCAGALDPVFYPGEVGYPPKYTTTDIILEFAIGKPRGQWTNADQVDVGNVLRHLGWVKKRTRVGKRFENRYFLPEESTMVKDEKT
ncbi:DEAD/DEAH box helicase family protein [Acidithiobacillus sp. MC6.1]|nr:DEAD/DEAH box helicase family protein [Acidithiobacillus sp. MC6.1]